MFFFQSPDGEMWLPNSVNIFFLHSKTQTCEVFQEVSLSENIFLHLNDRKKQAYNLVEMEFSSTDSLLKFGD